VLVSSAGMAGVTQDVIALLDGKLDKPVRQHELLDCLVRIHSQAPDEQQNIPAPRPRPQAAGSGLNILLAEDNKINQKFASVLLSKAGHTVTIVENGHQAVDAVRHGAFDIVLMDIQMPDLDGVGATREIRALPAPKNGIPIVAMTAHAMAGAKEEYLEAGMNDYVAKPIQQKLLFAVLKKFGASGLVQASPQPSPDEEPILDYVKLDDLAKALSVETIHELLRLFSSDMMHHAQKMTPDNLETTAQMAHAIVSSAGNIGVARLSVRARQLEQACRGGESENAVRLIDEVQAISSASQREIETFLAEYRAPQRATA
jgi:CheY-like chemotaxis protein